MKKNSLITLSLISVTLLAGCGTSTGTTDDLKTIGKAMEAGKSMKCDISMADENAPTMNMIYYVDGDNIRVESSAMGQKTIAIQKKDDTYMQPMQMIGDTDCKWMVISHTEEDMEEMENIDFDYEKYEADPNYKMECTFGSVDGSLFKTEGKTCTMDELMGGMDFGGMDLEGIDIEAFQ